MRVLVAFASRHGATAEIATEIGQILEAGGHEAAVLKVVDVERVDEYEAVVLGSAVQYGRWLNEAARFAFDHQVQLSSIPLWLFSSGPIGDPPTPPDDTLKVEKLDAALSPRGHAIFTGKMDRGQLSLSEKVVVGTIDAAEGDFRDWGEIKIWAQEICSELRRIEKRRQGADGFRLAT
jgi:menaquinone-dependent protoporphyrinogen oxidase